MQFIPNYELIRTSGNVELILLMDPVIYPAKQEHHQHAHQPMGLAGGALRQLSRQREFDGQNMVDLLNERSINHIGG